MRGGPFYKPKRRLRRLRLCESGKVCHESRLRADVALMVILADKRNHVKRTNTLNVYPCFRCGLWHIGNAAPDWGPESVTEKV